MKNVQQKLLMVALLGFSCSAYCMSPKEIEKQEELRALRCTFALMYGEEGDSKEGNSLPEGPLRAFFQNTDNLVEAHFNGGKFYNDHLAANTEQLRAQLKRRLSGHRNEELLISRLNLLMNKLYTIQWIMRYQ